MHSAPAVSYPVGRCHIQAGLAATLWVLGGVVCAVWIVTSGQLGWPQGLALLGCGLGGLLAWHDWQQTPTGTLRWDGQQWAWVSGSGSETGAINLALDWQSGVLLAWHPMAGRRQWLWLECASEPARWQAVRRALHARGLPGRVASAPDRPAQQGAA